MDKLQHEIDDVTKVMKENIQLLEESYDTSQELILAADILNNRSEQFSLLIEGDKQRMIRKSNIRTNRLILILIVTLSLIFLIVFTIIIRRN